MNPLKQLENCGQSPWLDYLKRSLIAKGELHTLIERDGIKGVTSNPSIFEKAIGDSDEYADAIKRFAAEADHSVSAIYEHLAIADIRAAADVLRPVYDQTKGRDGYISLECSPYLANDTDATVLSKTQAALEAGLTPIVCVGEVLAERESEQTEAVLRRQFEAGLGALTQAEFSRILLAYEPVWAIGTGKTATPELASQAHRYLRELAEARFSFELASALRILYGGSVKPDNIKGLMAQSEIDGALVGGASLDPQSFASIVNYSV